MISRETTQEEILKLAHPCKCHACSNSCNFGSGALADDDFVNMANLLEISEEELKKEYLEEIEKFHTKRFRPKLIRKNKMPYGKCIFYENEECAVHDAKPLECKIAMGCKSYGEDMITWFDLNYFVNKKDPESIRQWAASVLSGSRNISGGSLPELIPDKEERKNIFKYEDIKRRFNKDWNKVLGLKND